MLFGFFSIAQQPIHKICEDDSASYMVFTSYLQQKNDMFNFSYGFSDSLSDGLWILFKGCKNKFGKARDTLCYGYFKNGLRHGRFKYFNYFGYKIVNYQEGKKNGRSFTKYGSDIEEEKYYIMGSQHGPQILKHKGLLDVVYTYSNDKLLSAATYAPAGTLHHIKYGNDSIFWFGEKSIIKKVYYENDSLIKSTFYYENGILRLKIQGDFSVPLHFKYPFRGFNTFRHYDLQELEKGCWKKYNEEGVLIDEDCK